MRFEDEGFFGRLIKTLEFLAALYGMVMIVVAGVYTLYRLPFHYRSYQFAQTPPERAYFLCKLWACGTGGYAFLLAIALFGPEWFSDYWPAVCMLWTSDGWFGASGHVNAVMGDFGLCILACPACHWLASLIGKTLVNCDDEELFWPIDS